MSARIFSGTIRNARCFAPVRFILSDDHFAFFQLGSILVALLCFFVLLKLRGNAESMTNGYGPPEDLGSLPHEEIIAFSPDPELFPPLESPGPGSWRSIHPEPPQSYSAFIRSHPPTLDQTRKQICFQPIGMTGDDCDSLLQNLRNYTSIVFGLETRLLPPLEWSALHATSRSNAMTGNTQYLTRDVLASLAESFPADAFCVIAVTRADLYPDPSWNFVFGQARGRVGIFSLARYNPDFFRSEPSGDHSHLVLSRAAKVLVHETAHMFGLSHCTYSECLMNGANSLSEADATPPHFCPVCLHKLHHSTRFNLVRREEALLQWYQSNNFPTEADWTRRRLATLKNPAR